MPPPQQAVQTAPVFRLQSAQDKTLFLTVDDQGHVTLKPEDAQNLARQQFRFFLAGQIQNVALQGDDLEGGYLTRAHEKGKIIVVVDQRHGEDQNQKWNTKPGGKRVASGAVDEAYTLIVTSNKQDGILQAKCGQDAEVVDWQPYKEWDPDKANAVPLDQSWDCFRVA